MGTRRAPHGTGRAVILLQMTVGLASCGGPTAPSSTPGGASFTASYVAPMRANQLDPASAMKVWPYGVPGGDHPNGHPGIDFFLVLGADVLADQSGTVSNISASVYAGEQGIDLQHSDGYTSYITGFFQQVLVTKGQKVSQGQLIAKAAPFGGAGPASFHWGVVDNTKAVYCPADFLPADVRATMQAWLDQSTYDNKAAYQSLCNPCPAGGCR
jgi:murein DD-endopeptidase MepM/ murein hydrolase activator NlpD